MSEIGIKTVGYMGELHVSCLQEKREYIYLLYTYVWQVV